MSNGLLFIGVEKNNDDLKRHYFSSNKHDAAGEIIRCEARCCRMVSEGFPVVSERSGHTKSRKMNTGMEEGSRKLGGTRDSTKKNEIFAINLLHKRLF